MKLKDFSLYIIVLACLYLQAYYIFKIHFSGLKEYKLQVVKLKEFLKEEKIKQILVQDEVDELKQYVATYIPQAKSKWKDDPIKQYHVRNIASIVTFPLNKEIRFNFSNKLLNQGKKYFRNNKIKEANKIFKKFVESYSLSPHLPEAYFLLAEGQYLQEDYVNCLDTINVLLSHFPEHDLTGFVLLRMGKIYEKRAEIDQALEVYNVAYSSFNNKKLKTQAKLMIEKLKTY